MGSNSVWNPRKTHRKDLVTVCDLELLLLGPIPKVPTFKAVRENVELRRIPPASATILLSRTCVIFPRHPVAPTLKEYERHRVEVPS